VVGSEPSLRSNTGSAVNPVPLVCVVMLTHNHYSLTRKALGSLERMSYPNVRTLVVDNASGDETRSAIPQEFPEVRLVMNDSNLGFAAGMNVGIRVACDWGADYVFLVNNDITVSPGILEPLVEEAVPGVGAVAPAIYSASDPGRVWSAGFSCHPTHLHMRGGLRGEDEDSVPPDPYIVDYLLGCAMLLPTRLACDIGGFSERYFFYYEDLDLCLRIRSRGHRLMVVPAARMWHHGAMTSGADSPFQTYHMARGSAIFFLEHTTGWKKLVTVAYRLGSSVKKTVVHLVRGRLDLAAKQWQGLYDGWRESRLP